MQLQELWLGITCLTSALLDYLKPHLVLVVSPSDPVPVSCICLYSVIGMHHLLCELGFLLAFAPDPILSIFFFLILVYFIGQWAWLGCQLEFCSWNLNCLDFASFLLLRLSIHFALIIISLQQQVYQHTISAFLTTILGSTTWQEEAQATRLTLITFICIRECL